MPWDPAFVAQLLPHGPTVRTPRYLLESEGVPVGAKAFGGTLALSSFVVAGYTAIIASEGHSVSYGELQPRAWTASRGALTIAITGAAANDIRPYTARGQIVALRVGFTTDPADFEPVFRGRVKGLAWNGRVWLLRVEEFTGALVTRLATPVSEGALFYDLATVTASLTVGEVVGSTGYNVDDTAGFRDDGGSLGLFSVAPLSGAADFLVSYDPSLTTATLFDGCDDGTGGPLGLYGTVASAAAVGSTATEAALIVAHPISVALRILHSTGDGTNGAFDTLPESWGYGIPSGLVDEDDALAFRTLSTVVGGMEWQVHSAEAQPSPLAWMQSWLAEGGYFLTMRQGQLTVRAAVLPWLEPTHGHIDITPETGLRSIDAYEAWDPASPVEYTTVDLRKNIDTHASVTNTEVVVNLPAGSTLERSFAMLWGDIAESTAYRQAIAARLAPWDQRIPERIEMTLAGWWAGQASPGDTCTVDARRFGLKDRFGNDFDGTRRGYVVAAQPNWFGTTTRVVALFLPGDDDEGV